MSAPDNKNPSKRGNASGANSEKSKRNPVATKHSWNSGHAQRLRVLARLRRGPVTTCELQRREDVYDPPARVHELRASGHKIDTVWTRDETESGVSHRVGLYVLVQEVRP